MLPLEYVTAWRSRAPWPTDRQVEQDLIMSRLMIEIANHAVLGRELAMRGGTCFHKVFLPQPLRYSEDLDYVRVTRGPIKPIIEHLEAVSEGLGLIRHGYENSAQMVQLYVQTPVVEGERPIRIKIETNVRETTSCFDRVTVPYRIESRWFTGQAELLTFRPEEVLATKLRALYQRRKGRDLLDLWCGLSLPQIDDGAILEAHRHYMGKDLVKGPALEANLAAKLQRRDYDADIRALVTELPDEFTLASAAALLKARLFDRLT